MLAVSRSGYYEWLCRPPGTQAATDQQVPEKVQRYFTQGRGPYGTRRIKHLLAQEGLQVSRRRIGRLLAQAGLRCKTQRRFKAPTAAGQAQTVAPHQLNRAFTVKALIPSMSGILPISPRAKAGCLSLWCSICARGRWSDGRWLTICAPSW
jgi:transposase InsO family protein